MDLARPASNTMSLRPKSFALNGSSVGPPSWQNHRSPSMFATNKNYLGRPSCERFTSAPGTRAMVGSGRSVVLGCPSSKHSAASNARSVRASLAASVAIAGRPMQRTDAFQFSGRGTPCSQALSHRTCTLCSPLNSPATARHVNCTYAVFFSSLPPSTPP